MIFRASRIDCRQNGSIVRCSARGSVFIQQRLQSHLRPWNSQRIGNCSLHLPQQYKKCHFQVCQTYPTPETEKERSSVDYPQEWTTPPPSRRPDPLPEFEKLETPPPRKMPGDPEQPDEEEEEEKKKEKPEEDPEEQPEAPPSEE